MPIKAHPKIAARAMEARFTFADASRIIGGTASRFSRWTRGRQREYRGEPVFDEPLIRPDGDQPPLSFLNLIELRFLSSWRQEMSLPAIREALDYAAAELGATRPLLDLEFKRHGRDLFVAFRDDLVTTTRAGQLAFPEAFGQDPWPDAAEELLDSLDYDDREQAAYQWWPLGRTQPVSLNTMVNAGEPTTADAMVRTTVIRRLLNDGWDSAEIAADTAASSEEIRAAAEVEGIALAA